MVGLQDTGCVNYYNIVGPDHIRRNCCPRAGETLDSAGPYGNRFTQAWQKRLTIQSQTRKSQNLIDADSELTHVSESPLQVARFLFPRKSSSNFWGEAAMYYGFYLLEIALVVMIGQLAFALYQVASLLYLS